MLAFALTDPAEIKTYRPQPQFTHGTFEDGDDLVVHGAAVKWVRVADDDGCRALISLFRNISGALEYADGAAQKKFTAVGWKFPWFLDCPGFCHVLVHYLVEP